MSEGQLFLKAILLKSVKRLAMRYITVRKCYSVVNFPLVAFLFQLGISSRQEKVSPILCRKDTFNE